MFVFPVMKMQLNVVVLTILLAGPIAAAPSPPAVSAQTNPVEIVRYTWHDAKRERDVPVKIYFPETGNGPFPVIIFSHGLGGSREAYEYLGRHWAAHGYVSVHLQHPGSDDAIWREAGIGNAMAAMRKAAADPRNALDRPRDVSFAIDELEKLNRDKPPFQHRLDLDRIGVAGHSFGAFTALAVAGQVLAPGTNLKTSLADPRVKAVIPMSAPVPANKKRLDESYAGIHIPCLHMTGTRDSSPIGDTQPEERRLPFDHCRNSDQYLVIFKDGDHMIFSGRAALTSRQDRKFQKLICESSLAFWEAYLRGDAQAKTWLVEDFKTVLGAEGTFEVKFPK